MMQNSHVTKTNVPSQKLIDPFHASGPEWKMKTGAASSSVTIIQMDMYASHYGRTSLRSRKMAKASTVFCATKQPSDPTKDNRHQS
jgi:hypothetical protein